MARRVGSRVTLVAVVFFSAVLPMSLSKGAEAEASTPDGITVIPNATAVDCPAGYVCLFEHADFAGTLLLLHDCCAWEDLADYGFNNAMSSWRNRKARDAKVAEFANGNGDKLCLNSSSSDAWVGKVWNDRASSAKIFSDAAAC
jgi:hypothetical protein